jgi:hypothetical protein
MPLPRTSYMTTRTGELPADDDPLLKFEPVPHKQARRNSIGPERQRAFVAHLAATGIVTQAARHIGASLEALYKLRHRPGAEDFAAAWDAAVDRGVLRLEDCALARAIEGEERMVVSAGQVLGTERRHNEALVMFFLRQRRASRYGKDNDVGPGHPVYDKVAAAYEAERRREVNDPATMARIRKSIDLRVKEWRAELEQSWEAERQEWIAAHGGHVPKIDSFELEHRWRGVLPENDEVNEEEGSD